MHVSLLVALVLGSLAAVVALLSIEAPTQSTQNDYAPSNQAVVLDIDSDPGSTDTKTAAPAVDTAQLPEAPAQDDHKDADSSGVSTDAATVPVPREPEPPAVSPPTAKVSDKAAPVSPAASALDHASQAGRAALVNITCDSPHPVVGQSSGSGVIIDPKGIILTNAHVAQFFLIEKHSIGTDCIVRTGGPATPAYDAELIFLSPQWIGRNGNSLGQFMHGVNGDYDYALLGITKSLDGSSLPASFPHVPLAVSEAAQGEEVVLAGYAAELLTNAQIADLLYPTVAAGSVKRVESFTGARADIIHLGKSAAAQRGSSGGGIISTAGSLLGIMTIGHRDIESEYYDLSGISADYIRRTYEKEAGKSFDEVLAAPPATSIASFEWRIAELAKPLITNLSNADIYQWWYNKL